MTRDKARPAQFVIGSRSNSRDRFDLEAARSRNGDRTGTFATRHSVVTEEVDTDEEEDGEEEHSSLLNHDGDGSFLTPIRKPFRVSSVYGTIATTGSPHYLTLEGVVQPGGLKRNESIFKLTGMINDRAGEYEKYRMSEEDMKGLKSSVKDFYRTQNEVLDGFLEVDMILDSTRVLQETTGESTPILPVNPSAAREEKHNAKVKLAINVNFLINFLLLAGKIAVVLLSNSMSLIASTVDSAMDFLSTVIIFGTNRVIEHKDWKSRYNYPTGKKRMEPMGVVVFSVFMIASFLQVFIESTQRLLDKNLEPTIIPVKGIIVMISTIVIKIGVWFWCRNVKNSSVEALAQDAENDIVFNFFSLLFPYIGQKFDLPYLDPLGGALLSIYIMVEWSKTLLENVQKLSGKRASPSQHTRVAYLLTRFSPLILAIQHLSVYHTGDKFVVEADAILPRELSLTEAHDTGEAVQYALEQLEDIERAFVHIDISQNPLSGHIDR